MADSANRTEAAAWLPVRRSSQTVLEEVAAELISAGAIEPVLRLLDQFPKTRRTSSPVLALVRGPGGVGAVGLACHGRCSVVASTLQPMTLMSRGLYNEPAGAFLPSVLF